MTKTGFVVRTSIGTIFAKTATKALTGGRSGMKKACAELEGEVKNRAPVDTGHLRASYSSRVDTSGKDVVGHVGTNVDYGLYQEVLYTPHVRPAVDSMKDDIPAILGQDIVDDF